jgi:hypothetical protein
MNAASQLKWVMAGLRQAQPLDPPQCLTIYPNGTARTITQWGGITFATPEQVEAHIQYAQGKFHHQGMGGDGI